MYSVKFLTDGILCQMIRYKCGSYFLKIGESGMRKFAAKDLKIRFPDSFNELRKKASLRKYGD